MTNDKKQTALSFFLIGLIDLEIGKGISTDKVIELHYLFDQAKAMEREQIIESIILTIVGSNEIYDKEYPEVRQVAEQYYNETYGGDK